MRSGIQVGLWFVVVVALGCVSSSQQHVKRGDSAAAVQNWKEAVAAYEQALGESPNSAAVQEKYSLAKAKAISGSLATAERCAAERDYQCVTNECSYVLGLEPSNQEAARIRMAASTDRAGEAISNAQKAATVGEFTKAYMLLAESRALSSDNKIEARAVSVERQMAQPASTYVLSLMTQADAATVDRQVAILGECRDILSRIVPYLPEHLPLLAKVRTKQATALVEQQRIAQIQAANRQRIAQANAAQQARVAAQQAREAEARRVVAEKAAAARRAVEAEAARDKIRTVSLVGAVIGPGVSDGTKWDGPGKFDPNLLLAIVKSLATANPTAAVIAISKILANAAMSQLSKPDVFGTATLFVSGTPLEPVPLQFQRDTFTPQWTGVLWPKVDIATARLRVTLTDKDALADDAIGVCEIDGRELKTAQQAGGIFPVECATETSHQLLFIRISVI